MDAVDYAKLRGLRLRVVTGPHLERGAEGWGREPHNVYEVELFNGTPVDGGFARMRAPWRQGLGVKGHPEIGVVLDSLVMEAQGVRNADGFEDWAREYGEDPDSRKAERLYERCKALAGQLHAYLGPEWFEEALELDPL